MTQYLCRSCDSTKQPLIVEAKDKEEARRLAMRQWYGAPTAHVPANDGSNAYTGSGLTVTELVK